jgi:hypothetical protein
MPFGHLLIISTGQVYQQEGDMKPFLFTATSLFIFSMLSIMSSEHFNLIFQKYPEYFVAAKARKAEYWKPTDELPDYLERRVKKKTAGWRMMKNSKMENIGLRLYDEELREFIISNSKSVGTEKKVKINGQLAWSGGKGSEWNNRIIKAVLEPYFTASIIRQWTIDKLYLPKDKFIHFEYVFYYPFKARSYQAQDYFNHMFHYVKVFEDVLQQQWLENDSPQFVRGGYMRYVEVESEEDRRLEVKIHFCRNEQRLY